MIGLDAFMTKMFDEIRAVRADIAELKAQRSIAAVDPDELLTVEGAAKLRGCTVGALRKLLQRGRISCIRAGRTVRVRRRDVLGGEK